MEKVQYPKIHRGTLEKTSRKCTERLLRIYRINAPRDAQKNVKKKTSRRYTLNDIIFCTKKRQTYNEAYDGTYFVYFVRKMHIFKSFRQNYIFYNQRGNKIISHYLQNLPQVKTCILYTLYAQCM
jgi:hypothetical protein